jgi:hypothetical protein
MVMSGHTILFIQSGSGTAAQANPAPAPRAAPTRDQIRDQIRNTIRDATQAANQAAADARIDVSPDQPRVIINGRPVVVGGPGGDGGTIQVHRGMDDVIPPQLVDISIAFMIMLAVIIIGWPLARAMGRRLERRADTPSIPDAAIAGQLQRIEQAVEAMSIEIERISESQRFMAKLQSASTPERSVLNADERR